MSPWLTVVGIGEDGWRGLSRHARQALLAADTIFGAARHLALLPARIGGGGGAGAPPVPVAPGLAHRNARGGAARRVILRCCRPGSAGNVARGLRRSRLHRYSNIVTNGCVCSRAGTR